MKQTYSIIGMLAASTFVAALSLLVVPTPAAEAYQLSDFQNMVTNSSYVRYSRRSIVASEALAVRTQRGRTQMTTRVVMRNTYMMPIPVKAVEKAVSWMYTRSKLVMQYCKEKRPTETYLCFQENKRLIQDRSTAITLGIIQ